MILPLILLDCDFPASERDGLMDVGLGMGLFPFRLMGLVRLGLGLIIVGGCAVLICQALID